jgi:hypothetical protein
VSLVHFGVVYPPQIHLQGTLIIKVEIGLESYRGRITAIDGHVTWIEINRCSEKNHTICKSNLLKAWRFGFFWKAFFADELELFSSLMDISQGHHHLLG